MNIIDVKNLKHKIIDKDEEGNVVSELMAVDGVSLEIEEGQFIAIIGHNGSGKSTFAKHLNAILMPTEGNVKVLDIDTTNEDRIWDIRQNAGMVFQNPDNQIIATIVEEDVGFGPENLGLTTNEIWNRVNESLEFVDMTEYRKHSPNKLSGGQKQRVAIAGVLAMKPKCIILDEPTAMLDPDGRKEVINTITSLNKNDKITVTLVTHYMNEIIGADKVFVMDNGKVALSGTPREVFSQIENLKKLGLDVPQCTDVAYELNKCGIDINETVLTVDELVETLHPKMKKQVEDTFILKDSEEKTENIIEVKDLSYVYAKGTTYEQRALNNVRISVKKGEILGIIGHTGSGKSTLMQMLNRLLEPDSGQIIFDGKDITSNDISKNEVRKNIGLVFQYPEYQLFENSVLEDVCFGPKNVGYDKEEAKEIAKKSLSMVGISEEYYRRSPFELSGGEKRRVAIAGVIAMKPKVLILDEPTAGLDPRGRDEILDLLKSLRDENDMTIIIVSHSMEDMAKYADRIVVMNKGDIVYEDIPRSVFSHCENLESMGLSVPQVVHMLNCFRDKGIEIKSNTLSVEETRDLLLKYLV